MPRRYYKVDLYARGVVSTTGTITKTFGTSELAADQSLVVGGQTVRPTEGRTESDPFVVRVVDRGSTVSALLSNSSQRMHLLGRLCRVRRATDSTASSAFKTLAVGRLQDVALAPDVASYDFNIADERWIERNTDIFTKANTAALIPPGTIGAWAPVARGIAPAAWRVFNITGNLVGLRYDEFETSMFFNVPNSDLIAQTIEEDGKPGAILDKTTITAGNFTHLRWRNTGSATDYEVARFGAQVHFASPGTRPTYPYASMPLTEGLRLQNPSGERDTPQSKLYVWVVWTASQPSLDSVVFGYLYAPTHPPTDALPLHLGGGPYAGLNPFSLIKQIYDGTYSGSTSQRVRYSTAAFDKLTNDPRYGKVWCRVTSPQIMADFVERLYKAYAAVPLVNSSGKVCPVSMLLPPSTGFTLANLATLSSTNLSAHPTWSHPSREVVTVVQAKTESYKEIWDYKNEFSLPADRLVGGIAKTAHYVEAADTSTLFGRHTLEAQYPVVSFELLNYSASTSPIPGIETPQNLIRTVTRSVFARFADGPIYSEFDASTGIDATTNGKREPGSYIKVKLATYPNAGANARGSTRVMQIISRRDHPGGVSGVLLDVGAALNALTAPSLALALSSQSSRHAVKATVSSVPAGARYYLEMGYGATTASTAPVIYMPIENNTTASLTFVLGRVPSHTKVFGRVKAVKNTRMDSAFSAVQSVVTAKISGPTGFAVSGISAGRATFKWTNGSTNYPTEVLVDATSTATLGSARRIATLRAQTTRYDVSGLNAGDGHKAGVRHLDPFGGFSTQSVATFTTTTSFAEAPAMNGIAVVLGA